MIPPIHSEDSCPFRSHRRRLCARIARTLAILFVSWTPASADDAVRWGYLENGSGYLVISNRAAPMIGCSAIVQGGSGAESAVTQGASHFLEHLLFNGTETRTQEELYAGFDRLGTYSNATTRPTHVNYMILSPSDQFWDAFELQADMIFRSVLPAEKLEKERGILLEELAKSRLQPGYDSERLLETDLFGPRGYGLPTLGTEASIRSLTREQIQDFYSAYYGPERITWLLIGDFDPDVVVDSLESRIGVLPARGAAGLGLPAPPASEGAIRRDHLADVDSPMIRFVWSGMDPKSDAFLPFEARFQLLCEGDSSPLGQRASALGATRYQAGLRLYPGFSLQEVECDLPAGADADAFAASFLQAAADMAELPIAADALARWQVGRETDEVFLREKPHYYGIFRGDRFAARGLPAMAVELQRLRDLDLVQVLAAAAPLGGDPIRISRIDPAEAPHAEAAETVTSERSFTLPNGVAVLARSGSESSVFAAHLFIRGREAREPARGAAELLHSCLGRATTRKGETELAEALASIGAELKTHDSSFIPYDDFYSVPAFSYVRFQTLDRFAPEGLDLLAEIVSQPQIDEAYFGEQKGSAVQRARKEEGTPRILAQRAARDAYGLRSSNAYVFGVAEELQALDWTSFQAFTRDYLDPRGMLLVLASGLPLDDLETQVRETFGQIPVGDDELDPRFTGAPWDAAGSTSGGTGSGIEPRDPERIAPDPVAWAEAFGDAPLPSFAHLDSVGASQSYLLLTRRLDLPEDSSAAARLAAAWLSERISFQLREREGLAYSIGASISPLGGGAWLYSAAAGTREENLPRMLEGLREAPAQALAEKLDAEEIETLVARLEGRALMRRVTRLNWAYYTGSSWLETGEAEARDEYDSMRAVSPEEVRGVLARWNDGEEAVFLVR